MSLTEQQQRVVDAALGNLLISAAAGSGKTRVLVERIARRVVLGSLNVQNVLVMTFTNAAATHMSNRLETALIEAQAATADPREILRLSEQISLLPLAHISTIHSFCNDVIKNYGSELTDPEGKIFIEPGSSILDGTRSKIMLQEAVDRVLDELYALCHRVLPGSGASAASDLTGASSPGTGPVPDHPPVKRSEPYPFAPAGESLTVEKWCEHFMEMSLSFSTGRTDGTLREMILFFHSALRSLPDYEDHVCEMLRTKKAESEDFASSETAATLIAELIEISLRADEAVREAEPMLNIITFVKDKKKNAEQAGVYLESFALARELSSLLKNGAGWDDIVMLAARAPSGKFPGSPDKSDRSSDKSRFFSVLVPFFEVMYMLSGAYPINQAYCSNFRGILPRVFSRTAAEIQSELRAMYPLLARLFETVILTDRLYSERKRAENALDYSDQEQMALQLLKLPGPSGYYRELFAEIYIDEYQDNSRIQDAIIERISNRNVFYVGDVKQSIYRFRHARPDMFTSRSDRYRKGEDGTLLELNGNFRSRREILHFVNDMFSQLMSREVGEIRYDDAQRLDPMRTEGAYEDDPGEIVQVVLIERGTQEAPTLRNDPEREDQESPADVFEVTEQSSPDLVDNPETFGEDGIDLEAIEYEGLYVLRTIRELIGRFGYRYSDFAVLSRTNREAASIAGLLGSSGIPAQGPEDSALFTDRELLLMNHLILLIDNMRQDIPLCSVMRANFPDAGFTPEDLIRIYIFGHENHLKGSFFHEKVIYYSQNGPEPLRDKVNRFIDFIDDLRTKSMVLKVSELIEHIYRKTGMIDRLSVQENGLRRVAALETFREWANTFERGHRGGLYAFVRYIDEINRGEHCPEDFEVGEQLRNTVHCNSIHKSKGLEYKIVFVCGLAGLFNREGEKSPVLMHDIYGIASDFVHLEKGYSIPTVPKQLLSERERRAGLSENMRLLYVALTRAEERLYLIGSFSRKKDGGMARHEDFVTASLPVREEKLPPRIVMRAGSFLDLLLLGLSRNPKMPVEKLIAIGQDPSTGADSPAIRGRTKDITIRIIDRASLKTELSSAEPESATSASPDIPSAGPFGADKAVLSEEDRFLFKAQTSGVYAYEDRIHMPAKVTVSEMKRSAPPPEDSEEPGEFILSKDIATAVGGNPFSQTGTAELAEIDARSGTEVATKRPINLMIRTSIGKRPEKNLLTPTETGILLHSVFQYLDFSALPEQATPDDIRVELERMVRYDMIRSDQLPYLEEFLPDITAFSASQICARMKEAERKTGCGPFREIPFSITEPLSTEDFRLIQGMIDCWFIEEDGAVLVDYKSDRIRGDRTEKERVLKERYSIQLDYYARAIEAASHLTVKEKMIWLIPEAISFLL